MGETQKSPFGLASYLRKILRGLYVSPMFFDKVVMVDPVWWQLKLFQIQKSWNSGILGSFSRIFVEMFHAAKHSNLDRQKWNMINHPFLHSGVPSWNHICFPAFPPKSLPIKERIKAYGCLQGGVVIHGNEVSKETGETGETGSQNSPLNCQLMFYFVRPACCKLSIYAKVLVETRNWSSMSVFMYIYIHNEVLP